MTDKIKISASLQVAERYIAECLEQVTQDEPFVLDFKDSYGSYVQAVRDDFNQLLVEISGPESIEGELAPEVAGKLAELGWAMPRQPAADTPYFWREYPEDVDLKAVARDAIVGLAVAFPDVEFIDRHVEESEAAPKKKKTRIYSAWQNYGEAKFRCSSCKKSWLGDEVEKDYEGLVLGLRCPDCNQKLRNLSVEATDEQIRQFAAEGSTAAIEHLEMLKQMEARFAGEVVSAEEIATKVHEFQTDKAGRAYIDHPRRVVANLESHPDFAELSSSEQSAANAAAWLHDVVEDSGTNGHPHVSLDDLSKAGISPLAIRIIERMTRPDDKETGVQNAYYIAIANDPLAQLCKWSDIADNLNEQRLAALPEALQLKARDKYAHALKLMPMNAIQKAWLNARTQIAVD